MKPKDNTFVGDNDHGDTPVPPLLDEHNKSVKNSYQKIASKHHDTLQKLEQEEKTNG
jgi:hypothetical protein